MPELVNIASQIVSMLASTVVHLVSEETARASWDPFLRTETSPHEWARQVVTAFFGQHNDLYFELNVTMYGARAKETCFGYCICGILERVDDRWVLQRYRLHNDAMDICESDDEYPSALALFDEQSTTVLYH
ncbi:hypothetical protein ADM96_26280 [Burkholderia sp. ST111]|nr:hypothetical protein ADM96_26280 [Burkholderia sp. ST111]